MELLKRFNQSAPPSPRIRPLQEKQVLDPALPACPGSEWPMPADKRPLPADGQRIDRRKGRRLPRIRNQSAKIGDLAALSGLPASPVRRPGQALVLGSSDWKLPARTPPPSMGTSPSIDPQCLETNA